MTAHTATAARRSDEAAELVARINADFDAIVTAPRRDKLEAGDYRVTLTISTPPKSARIIEAPGYWGARAAELGYGFAHLAEFWGYSPKAGGLVWTIENDLFLRYFAE